MRECKLTISRIRGGNDEMPVQIEVMDVLSWEVVVAARVSLAGFTEALMGLGHVPGLYEHGNLGLIGCRREHKKVTIRFPSGTPGMMLDAAREAASQFELDGWTARVEDAMNPHNRRYKSATGTYEADVTFVRFVPENEG